MADLEKLANVLGAETIKRIYEDGFSGSVQEAGKMLTDLMKSLRLFTLPLQLSASYQDRITKYLDKARLAVPEKNQIQAPASLSGPIIERFKYLEESNYLTSLYINLLSRSIDKERVNEAHPAFFHIIDQLSPDEAYSLFKLKGGKVKVATHSDLDHQENKFINYRIISSEFSLSELTFPENFQMYFAHLESLNLIKWPILHTEFPRNELNIQTGIIEHGEIELTTFGKLFVKACIPETGFIFFKDKR
ncbi:DUF4393 domain-containing protein [Mucilaginibacter sp. ZT4R22]|uniref:DUF4393 domain-containing protein n=1 Tax=Mucilaginibacter pankratovii TaxID=2772110 RepID=A0ABR7WSI7_9SPHI|nr:Abi-alpha family protein [Mucilaginibacter pankratovii]MBD1365279.1 DUF4393 domain-containing protein [Mucilaginibacter pankratovii]